VKFNHLKVEEFFGRKTLSLTEELFFNPFQEMENNEADPADPILNTKGP